MGAFDTIIFDLGGVLIDWNPKYLYRDVFDGDEEKVDWFLNTICTYNWNMEHDAGRPLKVGTDLLIKEFPEYESWIRLYYDEWPRMLGGPISGTVAILKQLKQKETYNLLALTNWSNETFPVALERFEFLNDFEGIVVSGDENTRKPHKEIYEITLDRYRITPEKAVFIDDNIDNVEAANQMGITGIHFKNPDQLHSELNALGIKI
ncbi:HAD family phosphatase [Maribacter polysiphoniae]|uniref:2-haloacid dehalogenase n=1 Tax=Maribacter polysiphoniae TaxID=429344 RepID=A0A316DWE6_9FLAO|nr:HAD family phosphatase [Maribacter polysiphoniae]MBD1261751.1 HAD family phosphatase [Maribacter polysiphoniae]PWK22441.1 2-haloacid dehalogenase [Maribacter polysiphoniae]